MLVYLLWIIVCVLMCWCYVLLLEFAAFWFALMGFVVMLAASVEFALLLSLVDCLLLNWLLVYCLSCTVVVGLRCFDCFVAYLAVLGDCFSLCC